MERTSKFLQKIYVELLRVIRPLEKPGSYKKKYGDESAPDQENLGSSPRQSTQEDELDDDMLLAEG